jgi:hypothetical protein
MLSDSMLNVVMLSDVMLNAVALHRLPIHLASQVSGFPVPPVD